MLAPWKERCDKPRWHIKKQRYHFASLSDEYSWVEVWNSVALSFFGIRMKTDFSQCWGHCWVFHICWHIECSTFTAISFSILNSWTGILSPPLAWFIMMLPKALLTLHSRISGSRWVIRPSWLSGSWCFLFVCLFVLFYIYSSVYSYHLFLIYAYI